MKWRARSRSRSSVLIFAWCSVVSLRFSSACCRTKYSSSLSLGFTGIDPRYTLRIHPGRGSLVREGAEDSTSTIAVSANYCESAAAVRTEAKNSKVVVEGSCAFKAQTAHDGDT